MPLEKILSKVKGQSILEIEKGVVKYAGVLRIDTQIILTNFRLILKSKGKSVVIPLVNIRKLERAPKGWVSGEENKTILIDYYLRGERYRTILIVEIFRDDLFLLILRTIIGPCRIMVQYPSFLGGVLKTETKWAKGILKIGEKKLQMKTRNSDQFIDFNDIVDFGQNLFLKESSGNVILSILILTNGEEVGFNIFTESSTISFIEVYLKTIQDKESKKMDFDDLTNQLLFLLYTGYKTEEEIIEILGISLDELNGMYDKLIRSKTLKLVQINRIVELTNPTVKYVNRIVKGGFG